MKTLPFFLLLWSSLSSAAVLCGRSQPEIKAYLREPSSRVSFENDGGLFNGGVCWWHSRLQRSSAYLVRFKPDLNPPTNPELQKILHDLREMKNLVVIPGYHDFYTFSKDHHHSIQGMLDEWQKIDGFLNFEWLRGISGRSRLPAGELVARMDSVYNFYKKSPAPVWLMAQIKGVTSHSLLLLNMEKNATGYDLEVIDSNHPLETLTIEYHHGDVTIHAPKDKYTFVPYVGFQNDYRNILSALQRSCPDSMVSEEYEIEDGEVEISDNTEPQY